MDVQPQQAGESRTDRTATVAKPLTSVMAGVPAGVRPCSMAAALQIVGERWSLLALREMAYGAHRFAKIAGYTGAPRDILADPRIRQVLSGWSDWPTIPQLFVGGKLVGGCDIVTEMFQEGELQKLVAA